MQKNVGQFLQAAPGILPNDVLKEHHSLFELLPHTQPASVWTWSPLNESGSAGYLHPDQHQGFL
jgi:hypothetical protein